VVATVSTILVCLAVIAMLTGQWMTRPADMGPLGSLVAAIVIYTIMAGAPQAVIFAAAISCARQGHTPPSRWWTTAHLSFVMQFGAGTALIAGAILGEERLLSVAAMVLVVAALTAIGNGLAASKLLCRQSEAAREA
jgi:ABC-type multidrug transport system permease subunit